MIPAGFTRSGRVNEWPVKNEFAQETVTGSVPFTRALSSITSVVTWFAS